jgi:hypothetical protein
MDTLAVQLVVPTTKPTADFHRQVTAHAGRTKKIKCNIIASKTEPFQVLSMVEILLIFQMKISIFVD